MKLFNLLFLLLTFNATAQKATTCACEGFVDLEYKGSILLFDKPNGILLKKLKHDFKKEDYLIFDIDKAIDSFFHVNIQYAINGKSYKGWINKTKYLATFIRNYDTTISLYSKPGLTSKIKARILNN